MAACKRVQKELKEMQAHLKDSTLTAEPVEGDLTHWKATLKGPDDTPYAGGTFEVDIKIPADYPFSPPKMKFDTKIWHPNVSSQTGAICLDVLGKEWSPALTIRTALLSIQALMSAPEPDDPQDAVVAGMYKNNRTLFHQTAQHWTEAYASGKNATTGEAPPVPVFLAEQDKLQGRQLMAGRLRVANLEDTALEKGQEGGSQSPACCSCLGCDGCAPEAAFGTTCCTACAGLTREGDLWHADSAGLLERSQHAGWSCNGVELSSLGAAGLQSPRAFEALPLGMEKHEERDYPVGTYCVLGHCARNPEEYFIPGAFALASFMLAVLGLKKFRSFKRLIR